MEQDQAASQITRAIRRYIAERSYHRMTSMGDRWKGSLLQGTERVRTLSRRNLLRLQQTVQHLTPAERIFFQRIMYGKFNVSHATSASVMGKNGVVSLYSREKLIERGIDFDMDHTASQDISQLSNDDFVFFALEYGMYPKKHASRFGTTLYRFDFDEPLFQEVAWLSLVEMLYSVTPDLSRHIKGLRPEEYRKLSGRGIPPLSAVFIGKDMKTGLALSIINDLRQHVSIECREALLQNPDEVRMDGLINGLYRPEIKVPRHFFSENYSVSGFHA